jgi:hypothetical protein
VIDTAIIKAPAGQGCPRCGGVVYAAEQVLAKGRVSTYHIHYFNCLTSWNTKLHIVQKSLYIPSCFIGTGRIPHLEQGSKQL